MSLTQIKPDVIDIPSLSLAITQDTTPNGVVDYIGKIYTPTTITVGTTGAMFTTIQAAYDSIQDKRLFALVTILVANGTYTMSRIDINHHPDGRYIQILGNIANPSACALNFVADVNGYAQGIVFNNIQNIEFSGFKLTGFYVSDVNRSNQSIFIANQSFVRSATNSIILDSGYNGITVANNSIYFADTLRITNIHCISISAQVNSYANIPNANLTGITSVPTVNRISFGAVASVDSYVITTGSTLASFYGGVLSQHNCLVICDNATATNCNAGFQAVWSSVVAAQSPVANNCITGYSASSGGNIILAAPNANNCTNGYYAAVSGILTSSTSSAATTCTVGYSSDVNSTMFLQGTINAINCVNGFVSGRASVMSFSGDFTVTSTGTTTVYSPALNVVGNGNSIITHS